MNMTSQPDTPDGPVMRDESASDIEPRDVDFKAVARISTQARLKAIRLSFLHADMIETPPIPDNWTASVLSGFTARAHLERETRALTVRCGFVALYAPGVDPSTGVALPDPKDAPVELHAQFHLAYDLEEVESIEESDPQHFALSNGILHAWPYWRELAHSTTVRMGLTPLMIGMVKIPWTGDPATESSADDDAGDSS
jgi:hypothetical protein